jgi:hypothetical protein
MTVVCSGNRREAALWMEWPGYPLNCVRFRQGIERGYRSENGLSVRMHAGRRPTSVWTCHHLLSMCTWNSGEVTLQNKLQHIQFETHKDESSAWHFSRTYKRAPFMKVDEYIGHMPLPIIEPQIHNIIVMWTSAFYERITVLMTI